MEDFLKEFSENIKLEKNYSLNTVSAYRTDVKLFIDYLKKDISVCSLEEVKSAVIPEISSLKRPLTKLLPEVLSFSFTRACFFFFEYIFLLTIKYFLNSAIENI